MIQILGMAKCDWGFHTLNEAREGQGVWGGSKGEKMNFLYKRTDGRRAGWGGGRPQSCL